jgi:hypothetical protein
MMAPKSKRKERISASTRSTQESPLIKWTLIGLAMAFALVFLFLPLINVFAQAFCKGWAVYLSSLRDPDTLAAVRLTLLVAVITVPLNVAFGMAASWAIAKFDFRGKSLLLTFIRPAVCGLPCGFRPDVCAPVRRPGLLWQMAGGARNQDHLRGARHGVGDGVCHLSLCRPGIDSRHAGHRV